MMAADVKKSAQQAIVPPHYNDGFTRDICGDKLAWFFHLLDSANHLPGFAEDGLRLQFSNALLVGNFGNGHISAYDPNSGAFLGHLQDQNGRVLSVDGLWTITFGNGVSTGPANTLFFTAGIDDESHGLFGRLDAIQ